MSDRDTAPKSKGRLPEQVTKISPEQAAKVLKTIRDARDRGTREGQIREARKEGYVMVGIAGAGVIGR